MRRQLFPLPVAVLVTALAFFVNEALTDSDAVVPASAPATAFSGERAMQLLEAFLADGEAHPVGSAANGAVRERIRAWLDEQGIEHVEQQSWGCSTRDPGCAYTRNIVATVPGRADGPFVALMAHYDSTPFSPGAGDDMAGVVSILETARAVMAGPAPALPLLLLITDAEETGLHGAEAFFQRHPLAREIGVLLNVEGSGTRGVSRVLRTSEPNSVLMDRYADEAKQPVAISLVNEVFKRMPNDTDFTVSRGAGVAGIDFAFAGERNHYHTRNDSAANLDPRSIQHHGDNVLPLVVSLAGGEPLVTGDTGDTGDTEESRLVYISAFGHLFLWPAAWSPVLLALAGVLLAFATWKSAAPPLQLLAAATLLPVLLLAAGGALVHASLAGLEALNGTTPAWPAQVGAFRAVLFAATVLPALVLTRWTSRWLRTEVMLAGALCFLWLLTLALLVYLPDAVPVLLLPLLPAAALTAIACCLPEGGTARSLLLVLVLAPMALLLSAAVAFETSQGFRLAVAVWPWIGLFTVAAAAFARGRWLAPATAFTVALLAAALVAAALLPLHTAWRPQHLNAWYIQDSDRPEALVQILTDGTVPAPMHAAAAFLPEETASLPWSDERYDRLASVPSAALPPPTLALDEARATGGGRELRLRLASSRNASQLRLYIPTAAGLQAASVDGSALVEGPGTETDDFIRLRFHGVQGHEVPLTLRFAGKEPVEAFLVDMDPRMPAPASPLLEARPEWATPAHGGDQSVVFTRVRF